MSFCSRDETFFRWSLIFSLCCCLWCIILPLFRCNCRRRHSSFAYERLVSQNSQWHKKKSLTIESKTLSQSNPETGNAAVTTKSPQRTVWKESCVWKIASETHRIESQESRNSLDCHSLMILKICRQKDITNDTEYRSSFFITILPSGPTKQEAVPSNLQTEKRFFQSSKCHRESCQSRFCHRLTVDSFIHVHSMFNVCSPLCVYISRLIPWQKLLYSSAEACHELNCISNRTGNSVFLSFSHVGNA